MWETQLAAMAERGWHVIAPHARGFAADASTADAPAVAVEIDDFAGDIVDLMNGLHVHEAVFCGLSMGGYVAFALLRLAPRYVQGLVLADTRPQADTAEAREARDRNAGLARCEGVAVLVDQMLPKLVGETTRRERPAVAVRVRELALENSAGSIAAALGAMKRRPDSTALLHDIHVPTLVIVGDEDTITPPAIAEEMHRAIPGAELVVIPAAGHLSSLERPDLFNATLARFVDHRV
jgi:pimeloyl-ACP methyl ester carboxylesterase